jgi:hypothetical protein
MLALAGLRMFFRMCFFSVCVLGFHCGKFPIRPTLAASWSALGSFYQIGSSLRKRKAGLNGLGASLNQDLKRNFRLKPCRERRLVSKASWSQRVKRKSRIISPFGNRVFHV